MTAASWRAESGEVAATPLPSIRFVPGAPGAPLLLSFGFASWTGEPDFDFDGRGQKLAAALGLQLHRVLLRDPQNLWYQRGLPEIEGGVTGLLRHLRNLVTRLAPARIIVIGQSMGAYAALHYGRLLKADAIIAFGPQSALRVEQARAIGDLRWLSVMEALAEAADSEACLDPLALDPGEAAAGSIHIVYGLAQDAASGGLPNLDAWHAARLVALPGVQLHPYIDAPHAIVGWLKEKGLLDALLLRCARMAIDAGSTALMPPHVAPALQDVAPAPLSPGWRQWVAENRLRGCTPESMADGMAGHGIPRAFAECEARAIVDDPVYLAAQKFLALKAKLESVLANQQALWEAAPDYDVVERRSHVGREEFFRRYYLGCRPVVIGGMVRDWPAMQRWQPDLLAERFAGCEVEVQAGREADADYETNSVRLKTRVRFADFIRRIVDAGASNDIYLTANNHVFADPSFAGLHDDVGVMPEYLDPADFARHGSWWVGPAGAITPLHHDTLMLFHAQVVGRKRWRLISPLQIERVYNRHGVFSPVDLDRIDYERFPLMRGVRILDVVVEPGDAIFLPLAWWHQVTSLDVTVSLSFSNLSFPNSFNYVNPQIHNW